jgi:hypothetical protein
MSRGNHNRAIDSRDAVIVKFAQKMHHTWGGELSADKFDLFTNENSQLERNGVELTARKNLLDKLQDLQDEQAAPSTYPTGSSTVTGAVAG